MTATAPATAPTDDHADTAAHQPIVLERAFAAPRELLFRMFTEPEHLVRWWCPYPLTFPVCEWDPRPGGALHVVMQAPDGTRFPFTGVFNEVQPPVRLVFSSASDLDEAGVPQTEVINTVTFTERGPETLVQVEIAVTKAGPPTAQTLIGMADGWMQDFGRLAFAILPETVGDRVAYRKQIAVETPSEREIVLTRSFAAPRTLVFRAMTDPAMIPNWWGPRHLTTAVETMEVRPGGRWRYLTRTPDGQELAFRGEFILLEAPELMVWTFEFEPMPGKVSIDAAHLHERNGVTLLTAISLFPSKEARDAMLATGMTDGAGESYDRLEELLAALA